MWINMLKGYITPVDLNRTRSRCKLGAVVDVVTYKSYYSAADRMGSRRKGIVIKKYQYFAVVRLPNGVLDSVLWVDLIGKGV